MTTPKKVLFTAILAVYGIVVGCSVITHQTYDKKADFYEYAMIADNLWNGRGLMFEGYIDVVLPPGWPIVMGAANFLFHDWRTAGKAVNLILLSVSLILFYRIARRNLDVPWSRAAAILLALNSNVVINASDGLSESLFMSAFLGLVIIVFRLRERVTARPAFVFALLWALLYYVRPEGLIIGSIGFIWIVKAHPRTMLWLVPLMVFILMLPYLIFLKSETGIWQLSGKTHLNLVMGELDSPYQTGDARNTDPRYDRYWEYLKDPSQAKSLSEYWNDPHNDIPKRVFFNLLRLLEIYWFTFSAAGIFIFWGAVIRWPMKGFLTSFLILLPAYGIFFILPRTIAVYHWIVVLLLIFGIKDCLLKLNSMGMAVRNSERIQYAVWIFTGLYEFRAVLRTAVLYGLTYLK